MNTEPGTSMNVAVIGMAGRFPGARDIDEFWENLKHGKESITFFSDEELMEAGVSPELLQDPAYVKAGGILDDPDRFDALFFDYLPSEASIMAPQVRLFHECVWHALENAGYVDESSGKRIGVYAGGASSSQWEALVYLSTLQKRDKEGKGSRSFAEGMSTARLTDKDSLTTLVSHKLNLTGPSFHVQAGCSTSLAAIHLAAQGILNGECEIAAAGGAALAIARDTGYLYQPGGILSPDGHNRTFDARGKGTVGGDGAGVVVLKLLEDAIADNDHIYAVIKGSAINNDGERKVGYMAPSVEGQAEAIGTAHYIAGIDPETVTYIEAHGTATELGDPIEVEALTVAFNTNKRGFCALGSVKPNIGHLDPAAGASGFIKTVLALEHRQIPPILHYTHPNPKIEFVNSPFYVNTRLRDWDSGGHPRRAGVSSFGIGGTNVHIVLEEAPGIAPPPPAEGKYRLLLLSARTAPALEKTTANLAEYLKRSSGADPGDVAYTLQVGRKAFEHRRMTVCAPGDAAGTAERLSTPGAPGVYTAVSGGKNRPVCFMFPGQGSQYETMGMDLYRSEPLFREEIDTCFEILSSIGGEYWSYRTYGTYMTYAAGEKILTRTGIAQPVLFAFEYALAKLLMHWGIKPYALIGHSIGEYAAACLSGVFSLEDALRLVALRGRLMQEMPPGSMAGVTLPREELEPLLPPDVALAAVNSPGQCVVSGPPDTVAGLVRQLEANGHRTRTLHTSHAFHSAMMDPILAKFEEKVRQVKLNEPGIPFVSNVTGTWISNREAVDPAYWARHLRRTVMFGDGIKTVVNTGIGILVEVGPGTTLSTFARQAAEGETRILNLIPHPGEEADGSYFLNKIGHLWLYGISIDWNRFYGGETRGRVPLPLYPFEGKRYGMEYRKFRMDRIFQPGTAGVPGETEEDEEPAVPVELEMTDRPARLTTAYTAPRNPAEEALVKLLRDFFGIRSIGIHDDFFELGGDSLKAMTLLPKIRGKFGVEIKLAEFFRCSTAARLAEYFKNHRAAPAPGTCQGGAAILPAEKKEYYAMSSPQRRYYVLQQLDPANTVFNICQAVLIEGKPDMDRLQKVFAAVIDRHETFRTSFVQVEGTPVQRIHSVVPFEIETLPPSCGGIPSGEEIIETLIRPFDLSRAPLLRAGLSKLDEEKYLLVIDVHHIVSDGLTQRLLVKEFLTLYRGVELPPLKIGYKDFSEWQNSAAGRVELKRQEAYWLEVLKRDVFVHDLPLDFPREGVQCFEGDFIEFDMDPADAPALRKLAADHGATVYMVLLAVLNIWMAKICSRETAVIGSGIGGRKNPDLQHLAGSLQNMILLINDVDGSQTFSEFLEKVKRNALEAFENQDYPFDELVAKAPVPRGPGRNPLFDFFYILTNADLRSSDSPDSPGLETEMAGDLKFSIYPFSHGYKKGQVRFDLALYASDRGKTFSFIMEYGTRLFRPETVERLVKYFQNILAAVLADSRTRLKDIAVSQGQKAVETRFDAREFLEFTF